MRTPKAKTAGFTLVELMVTVAILAILGAVAVPMYGASVKKARAGEGQAALSLLKAKQEMYRSTRFSYADKLSDLAGYTADESKHGDYFLLEVVKGDRNGFVARAWDGQKAISGTAGDEEWYITNDLDEPCRTKSTLADTDDPCVETVKKALE